MSDVRQTSGDPNGVVSGYEGNNVATDFFIPSCGIEDADRALFKLFDEKIGFQIKVKNELQKVPVIFAAGERFAMLNRNKPIRDRNGALILPLISIRRTSIEQSSKDLSERGINQHTGDLVIKRKLSPRDRNYQLLVNKLQILNQDNIAVMSGTVDPSPVSTFSDTGELKNDLSVKDGGWLRPHMKNNIFEFITIPQPQFYTAVYEITFWMQYQQDMNYMIERMMNSYLPQGRSFKLETDKGYWFVAYMPDSISSQDNFENFTEQERIVKMSFQCKVPAYFVAPDDSGNMSPFRKLVSAPQISFGIQDLPGDLIGDSLDPDQSADDPTDPFTLTGDIIFSRKNQKLVDKAAKIKNIVQNPFTGEKEIKFIRLLNVNEKKGETVYSGQDFVGYD